MIGAKELMLKSFIMDVYQRPCHTPEMYDQIFMTSDKWSIKEVFTSFYHTGCE